MTCYMTPEAFLSHWQAHRRLTRRTIQAFGDDQLFGHSLGGMRSFGTMCLELIGMAAPMVSGLVTDNWDGYVAASAETKEEVLRLWDASTAEIDSLWPKVPASKWPDVVTAFGMFTAPCHDLMLYIVDNEIHHRGQGYVYLRDLGVEPPPFYERI